MRSAASDISGVPNAVIMMTAVLRRHMANRRQQREVVRIRQTIVEQHDVERAGPAVSVRRAVSPSPASLTRWPLSVKRFRQRPADQRLVVDDQDPQW